MKNRKRYALIFSAALALSILATGCSAAGKRDTAAADSQSKQSAQSSQDAQDIEILDNQGNQETQSSQDAQGTAAELGSLRSFTAKTLDGGTFTQENFRDKDITILNFWSTMCGACIDEMPDLAKFARALPDNVQVVTVCLDGSGMEEYVKELLGDFDGITLLSGDGDYKTVDQNIQYTPTTVLVDSEGSFVGDAIIGGQEDLSNVFLEAVNSALKTLGKEEISLAG